MARAIWRDKVLAESEKFELVEGNVYFPPGALDRSCLKPSTTTTVCPWKGLAHYFTVVVEGQENADAAWYYPTPKPAAAAIKDHVAFWHGIRIER